MAGNKKYKTRTIKISPLSIRTRKLKKMLNKPRTTIVTGIVCLLLLTGWIYTSIDTYTAELDEYFSNPSTRLVADKALQGEGGIYNLGLVFYQEIAYRNIREQN